MIKSIKRVQQLLAADAMVTCRWPDSGDLKISLERAQIEEAMALWIDVDETERQARMASVRQTIDHTTKRLKNGQAEPDEVDALAVDIALFLGHELLHADGEHWLVRNPAPQDIGDNNPTDEPDQ